jgi:predicted nucleic acid-binding protein
MKKIVLDTSVILKWFVKEKGSQQAKNIFDDFKNKKITLILPELLKYELGNAFLKGKKISFGKIKKSLAKFYRLPIHFVAENEKLSFLTYQIAEKLNITYYDACFLALAKQEKATLVTTNPKHQKKIKGVKVKNLNDYLPV